MPAMAPERMTHHTTSQADLDILALLTSDQTSLGPLSGQSNGHGHGHGHQHENNNGAPVKKQLPRRESHMDALLISAVLAGSGPLTRHHFGHGPARPGAYASCDESRPTTPSRPPLPNKVVLRSLQAPRSERLRIQKDIEEGSSGAVKLGESSNSASAAASTLHGAQSNLNNNHEIPSRQHRLSISSTNTTTKPRRRMSIDPAPISQMLQAASPSHNYFAQPTPPSLSPPSIHGSTTTSKIPRDTKPPKPLVRCMARTRIPTPHGELFLHLYHNNQDQKEHLAIVIDPIQLSSEARVAAPSGRREIRSKSLDCIWREGETDMERVVRGAYTGRLVPGGEGMASVPPDSFDDEGLGRKVYSHSIPEMEEVQNQDQDQDQDHSMDEGDQEEEILEEDILPMVRIHSECYTGETIGSMRCDCGEQLDEALRLIAQPQRLPSSSSSSSKPSDLTARTDLTASIDSIQPSTNILPTPMSSRSPSPGSSENVSNGSDQGRYVPGRGVVIYMRQEGRGIGLLEKIRAYNLQDLGHDTVTANLMLGHGADERTYGVAAEILKDLGLAGGPSVSPSSSSLSPSLQSGRKVGRKEKGIRLLTNNPEKVEGLAKEGISVLERVGMVPRDWKCRDHHYPSRLGGQGEEENEKEYKDWRDRRAGVGLIGAGKARGPELEKYLRTKVERMGHMIDIPDQLP